MNSYLIVPNKYQSRLLAKRQIESVVFQSKLRSHYPHGKGEGVINCKCGWFHVIHTRKLGVLSFLKSGGL